MKTLKILSVMALVFSGAGFSQNTNIRNDQGLVDSGLAFTKSELGAKPTGSPYLEDNFSAAKLQEGSVTLIRYNAYADRIEFKDGTEDKALVPEKDVLITTVDKKYTYQFTDYTTDSGEAVTGYLLLIGDNANIRVYERNKIVLQKESAPSNGYASYKPANFRKPDKTYFIKIKDGPIVSLPSRKKNLLKVFPGKEAAISDFLSKNKTDLEKENDVKKFGEFVNTLY